MTQRKRPMVDWSAAWESDDARLGDGEALGI